ncbi:predicted protein [Thalassiosira pseudonana CCMP1335]|uniref:Uncharacterized protein n=1 Tax=Thalassiosira pseudonana TaxID=35128 RepID=B8C0W3_THAPS|nr:predicted protein [Thalassiosira pseudonana CCMP1335]EED92674.1 predicted protein [Thalassiosira pseudonana CCMP1335]
MAAKGITMRHSFFTRYQDFQQLFGTDRGVQEALMNRFVGRPVHEICYYHSYHPVETTLEKLQNKIIQQLTDNHQQQDTLGMTPLHILACSKRQSLDLYRLVVEHFPDDLICKDKWGKIPIFYALWSIAPDEIVQFLIESIKAAHPQYELDWKGLLKDFVVNGASMEVVERVVSVQQAYFPEAKMDWVNGLDEILQQQRDRVLPKIKKLVFKLIVKTRVESLSKEEWRQDITTQINALPIGANDRSLDSLVGETHSNLEHYEMVDATSLLELAVWKMKIDEQTASNSNSDESHQIRANVDNIEFREILLVWLAIVRLHIVHLYPLMESSTNEVASINSYRERFDKIIGSREVMSLKATRSPLGRAPIWFEDIIPPFLLAQRVQAIFDEESKYKLGLLA